MTEKEFSDWLDEGLTENTTFTKQFLTAVWRQGRNNGYNDGFKDGFVCGKDNANIKHACKNKHRVAASLVPGGPPINTTARWCYEVYDCVICNTKDELKRWKK